MTGPPDNVSDSTCSCKVGTVASEYGLTDVNEELVDQWTGRRGETKSVRTLADWFNRRLLREEMRAADIELVDGRVENLYRLLTDDTTLEAVQLQARSVLRGDGVDVEQLETRFISHQSLYRHLRNCLNAEKERHERSVEKERDRINSLQNRTEAVINDSIGRLCNGDEIALTDFEVLVNFRVTCEECGSLHDVASLLADGGCNCQQRDED